MLQIDRLLHPTDFSECSEGALPVAVLLAEAHEAELHALHALVLHAADETDVDRLWERLAEEARAELRAIGEGRELRVSPAVARGISAAPVILDYASEQDVDLIVMGTHGRRGVRRWLAGSVAEEVVRLAPCPVLTVQAEPGPSEAGAVPGFQEMVVPVDFSSHSRLAVAHARELAETLDARVSLVHVVEQAVYPDFYLPVHSSGLDLAELRETAAERLRELADEAVGAERTGAVEVRVGRTVPEIIDFVEARGADLVVIASHGLQGLERVLLGSVAERVVRSAPCSVFTVKAFGKRILPPGEG